MSEQENKSRQPEIEENSISNAVDSVSELQLQYEIIQKPAKPKGPMRRFWSKHKHLILLMLTAMTTYYMGMVEVSGFHAVKENIEPVELVNILTLQIPLEHHFGALIYTFALLGFLGAHEMGHYLMCRFYGIRATLPYFLPNPLIFGSFGAVIRIKSPIRNKKTLFDVGIAGPLAGFVVAVPILFIGMMQSHILVISEVAPPAGAESGFITLGEPLIQNLINQIIYVGSGDKAIFLSPLAWVGWFACLVTAINLLPVSQLDGGHIFYAVFGRKHYFVSVAVVGAMVLLALFMGYYGWLVWALLIVIFFKLKHPPVVDEDLPLDLKRKLLALVALAILILCFVPVPINMDSVF
jgi:membrane-associated protease RseP (regulator of RpoE activity)